jgi:hypothetical protein
VPVGQFATVPPVDEVDVDVLLVDVETPGFDPVLPGFWSCAVLSAPQAASAAHPAVVRRIVEKRLIEAIKSPLRAHRLVEIGGGAGPNQRTPFSTALSVRLGANCDRQIRFRRQFGDSAMTFLWQS